MIRIIPHSKSSLLVVTFLLLAIAPAAEGQSVRAYRPAKVLPFSTASHEAYKYVRETTTPHIPHRLNLADPKQYQYVVDSFERGGLTRTNSPQLYRVFDSLRSKGAAGPPVMDPAFAGKAVARSETALDEVPNTVPINLIGTFLNSPSNYRASTLSSYPGGTMNTAIATLFAYSSGNNQWVTFGAGTCTQQLAGTNFWCDLYGSLPSSVPVPVIIRATSNIIVTVRGAASATEADGVYTVSSEDSINAASGCLTAPNFKTNPRACTNTAPVSTTPIAVCWNRSSPQNCDYWHTAPPNPTNFVFPLAGSAIFATGNSIFVNNGVPTGITALTLNVPNVGGGCVLSSQTGAGLAGFTVSSVNGGTNNKLNWNFSAANFPNNNGCLGSGGVLTNLNMTVSVALTNGQFGSFIFSSDTSNIGPPNPYYIPQIKIWWGCVAAGTKIYMADGSERPVESFEGDGSEWIRDSLGKKTPVTATAKGEELEPLYVITDDKDHTVKLSSNHPVYTARGVVVARDLRVGDRLITISGPGRITSITREQAVGEVWNLNVGSESSPAGAKPGMYANGIFVGDWNAQQSYLNNKTRKPMSSAEILRKLPPEWREDYRNYLKLRTKSR